MNRFEVKLLIETYSEDPDEWIIDAVDQFLEEDESLISIRTVSIKPMYVRDIAFSNREQALTYCQQNGLSPTLIHHEPTKPKDD